MSIILMVVEEIRFMTMSPHKKYYMVAEISNNALKLIDNPDNFNDH